MTCHLKCVLSSFHACSFHRLGWMRFLASNLQIVNTLLRHGKQRNRLTEKVHILSVFAVNTYSGIKLERTHVRCRGFAEVSNPESLEPFQYPRHPQRDDESPQYQKPQNEQAVYKAHIRLPAPGRSLALICPPDHPARSSMSSRSPAVPRRRPGPVPRCSARRAGAVGLP